MRFSLFFVLVVFGLLSLSVLATEGSDDLRPVKKFANKLAIKDIEKNELLKQKLESLGDVEFEKVKGLFAKEHLDKVFSKLDKEKIRQIANNSDFAYKLSQLGEKELEKLSRLDRQKFEEVLGRIKVDEVRKDFLVRRKEYTDKKDELLEKKELDVVSAEKLRVAKQRLESARPVDRQKIKEHYQERVIELLFKRLDYISNFLKIRAYADEEFRAQVEDYLIRLSNVGIELRENPTKETIVEAKALIKEFTENYWNKHRAEYLKQVYNKCEVTLGRLVELDNKANELLGKVKEQQPESGIVNAFEVRLEKLGSTVDSLKTELSSVGVVSENEASGENAKKLLRIAHATREVAIRYHNVLRVLSKFYNVFEDRDGELPTEFEVEITEALDESDISEQGLLDEAQTKVVEQETAVEEYTEQLIETAKVEEEQTITEVLSNVAISEGSSDDSDEDSSDDELNDELDDDDVMINPSIE